MAGKGFQMGLTDTDICIDAARGKFEAFEFLEGQRQLGQILISVISAMELVQGCKNKAELLIVRRFLGEVVILDISPTISRRALQLMEEFSLSHGLRIPDALIAATALECNLVLYTLNVRHFQMIKGLKIIRPY